ncbi:alkene reductase [Corynebacterium sp. 3HC-13]|uniref:alkene reductase n=1 Tax=Corynebacterium poyangense TaxID=2684405 RepID=UPI001CCD37DA|nr:alkene reductase [Corynebacterium poyangense]MBZ8177647.1 alkene reductase [Corynebacterium poyangense]
MSQESALYQPFKLGNLELANRVVMAPLTRLRADPDGTPNSLMAQYYRQRAGCGLIISEGTWPVQEGRTWSTQPGIATEQHIAEWRAVSDAVHAEGGKIFMQIMHGGRISHPQLSGSGRIVAPSAYAAPGMIRLPDGSKASYPVPQALTSSEIPEIISQFALGARNAMEAGMDGVQIHGANGYLVHQFFSPSTNERSDVYGGSPENRARFGVELVRAVAHAIGAEHTAIRLSPEHNMQGALEEDPELTAQTYTYFAAEISDLPLSHIEVLHHDPDSDLVQNIRRESGAPLIVNTGFNNPSTRESAENLVSTQVCDAVSVGRYVIANPDLVQRWQNKRTITEPDTSTFYIGGPRGYIDYPRI